LGGLVGGGGGGGGGWGGLKKNTEGERNVASAKGARFIVGAHVYVRCLLQRVSV